MGFFNDLVDSFTGKAQRDELQSADRRASKFLKQGYDDAYGDFTGAYESFQPYAESGTKNQKIYDDLQGLNGPEAQAAAQEIYANDPYEQNALGQALKAAERYGNAMAWGRGKEALAGTRIANSMYRDWKSTYAGGADRGLAATNSMAAARTNRGNLSYGYGATRAGQAINMGNAMAEARGIGVNNLLKLGELGTKAASAAMSGGFA